MKIYLLIQCSEDGDTYQTFDDLNDAKKEFKTVKKYKHYHTLVLVEIKPNQRYSFSDYGFTGEGVIDEWSRIGNV